MQATPQYNFAFFFCLLLSFNIRASDFQERPCVIPCVSRRQARSEPRNASKFGPSPSRKARSSSPGRPGPAWKPYAGESETQLKVVLRFFSFFFCYIGTTAELGFFLAKIATSRVLELVCIGLFHFSRATHPFTISLNIWEH